ncbi:MAG TPA: hypothetical protein PKC49_01915 [Phycisphaerae bacterium]|nr:hypothetical protein [Phycisphaerae bacterium]
MGRRDRFRAGSLISCAVLAVLSLANLHFGCAPGSDAGSVLGDVFGNPQNPDDPNDPAAAQGGAGGDPAGAGGEGGAPGSGGEGGTADDPNGGDDSETAGGFPPGTFIASSTRLDFGASFNELWFTLQVDRNMEYTLTPTVTWAQARVAQRATLIGDRIAVNVNRAGLAPGGYFGVLRLSSPSGEIAVLLYLTVPSEPLPPGGPAGFSGLGDVFTTGLRSDAIALSPDGLNIVGRGQPEHMPTIVGLRWNVGSIASAILNDLAGGGTFGVAHGASDVAAVMVGQSQSGNGLEAYRNTAQGLFGLGDLPGGGFNSAALAVSADGLTIVGYGTTATGMAAMRWRAETGMVELPGLSGGTLGSCALDVSADGSVIVGYVSSQAGKHACRWIGTVETLPHLPGGHSSEARAVSAGGAAIVGLSDSNLGPQAFRWTSGGGTQGLGDLPGGEFYSCANGVNTYGDIVVGTSLTDAGFEAFIWTPGGGIRRLHEVLVNVYGLDLTGWTLTSAQGISSNGKVIVGRGTNPVGQNESWVVTLP